MTVPYVRTRVEAASSRRRLRPVVRERSLNRETPTPAGPPPVPERIGSWRLAAGVSSSIAAALLLGFVAVLLPLGALKHDRDQAVKYDDYRLAMAQGTAPVGQRDEYGRPLDLGTPIALLTIPRLGLQEVVSEGTTGQVLRSGPGHRRDTVLPGQAGSAVVFGRRAAFGGPFSRLSELRLGDIITVITGQGRFRYLVAGKRQPGDPAPAALPAGASRLTLVTAAGSPLVPSGALRVDALLSEAAQPAPARTAGIADSERPLASDPSAWLGVLLWGELLLALALLLTWTVYRWGRWQTWIVAVPALLAVGVATATQASSLLPNLI